MPAHHFRVTIFESELCFCSQLPANAHLERQQVVSHVDCFLLSINGLSSWLWIWAWPNPSHWWYLRSEPVEEFSFFFFFLSASIIRRKRRWKRPHSFYYVSWLWSCWACSVILAWSLLAIYINKVAGTAVACRFDCMEWPSKSLIQHAGSFSARTHIRYLYVDHEYHSKIVIFWGRMLHV